MQTPTVDSGPSTTPATTSSTSESGIDPAIIAQPTGFEPSEIAPNVLDDIQVIRRNGKVTHFDASKIAIAMTKAFLAVEGGNAAASRRIHDTVKKLTEDVIEVLRRRSAASGRVHIEEIQDQVELALMRGGEQKVARDYVLYREQQTQKRADKAKRANKGKAPAGPAINVTLPDGSTAPLDFERLQNCATEACANLEKVSADTVFNDTVKNLFDGVNLEDVSHTLCLTARTLVEKEPNYSFVAARLLMDKLRTEALSFTYSDTRHAAQSDMAEVYTDYFPRYIKKAAELEHLDSRLAQYDLELLAKALDAERDLQFGYLGLQTLYDRYFMHPRLFSVVCESCSVRYLHQAAHQAGKWFRSLNPVSARYQ